MSDYDYSIHYCRFHDDTEEHVKQMASWLKSVLAPLLPPQRDSQILDIGCGFGFAMLACRELGYQNLRGLEIAPEQAQRALVKGLNVAVVADTRDHLLRTAETYDVILLMDVLEHIPVSAQIGFVKACLKVLSHGGRMILTVPNASSIMAMRWRYGDFTHFTSFTEHSLDFVLKNGGFRRVEFLVEKKPWRPPLGFWRRGWLRAARKWLIRYCWLQVCKAELAHENIDEISLELNLTAVAYK